MSATDNRQEVPHAELQESEVDDATKIRIAGQNVVPSRKLIPHLALTLMLMGIVMPSATYSFKLSNPTPSELLIAICISLFSGVVFLWILDATSILRFRAEWISKSVYGAAIASVLGTSVGVYSDAFGEQKYPYEGRWELKVRHADQTTFLADHTVVLAYSGSAKIYWGFGDTRLGADKTGSASVEVVRFSPEDQTMLLRLVMQDGSELVIDQEVRVAKNGASVTSLSSSDVTVQLARAR